MTPPLPPTPPQPSSPSGSFQADGGSFGRDVRLVTGAILLLGNAALVFVDATAGEKITWPDVTLHGCLLVASLLLMDPRRTLQLIGMVKDKIPFVGGQGGA